MTSVIKRYYDKWKQIGAIAPSSRFLARAIINHIAPSDHVLEIGAGTGVFTRKLAQKVPNDQLHVLEIDPEYEERLEAYTPNVHIIDALDFLASPPLDLTSFKAVSGLPLLNFEQDFRKTLLTKLLLESGVVSVRQFTYSPRPLFDDAWLEQKNLQARRVKLVLLNLPPAFVWEYTNRD